ncbi:extracellular solute-binding protein [Vallitalea guaymasensis]|uniref:extracellular solute-binding protein n=1 Tax=Vallitalea guaymasensis TaxID=1185412 RepID=UPI00272B3BFF|nr:extracellular solute-binding protein [Vallitalea guaymasensis]
MKKKALILILVLGLLSNLLVGCGGKTEKTDSTDDNKSTEKEASTETPYIEVWTSNAGFLAPEKGGPVCEWIKENTGIGVYSPYVPWEGGNAYIQKLNTAIASRELPDMFLPWKGVETTLAKQGAIADLTDLLPKYAPSVWERIPEEVWNIVKAADPNGEGKIYYIPKVDIYNSYGTFVRQDWLDRVGLDMPQTQNELVKMLEAFRDQDADGDGNTDNEVPTSGREFGRWMDQLYGIYGVAMWEGYPMWDIYEGELTYSGVTKNMRAAIEWMRELYAEKLLDNDTFLNAYSDWQAKITSGQLGMWYHLAGVSSASSRFDAILQIQPDADFNPLPNISAEGYEGFVTHQLHNRPEYVIANKDEETIINCLKVLEWFNNPDNYEAVIYGPEGVRHEVKDGKKIILPVDKANMELIPISGIVKDLDAIEKNIAMQRENIDESRAKMMDAFERVAYGFQENNKTIAGDGLPSLVFEGYPDIKSHTLYQEYMTKIIIGEWPIEKFDEFVELWYNRGGTEVTKKAREWYSKVSSN